MSLFVRVPRSWSGPCSLPPSPGWFPPATPCPWALEGRRLPHGAFSFSSKGRGEEERGERRGASPSPSTSPLTSPFPLNLGHPYHSPNLARRSPCRDTDTTPTASTSLYVLGLLYTSHTTAVARNNVDSQSLSHNKTKQNKTKQHAEPALVTESDAKLRE